MCTGSTGVADRAVRVAPRRCCRWCCKSDVAVPTTTHRSTTDFKLLNLCDARGCYGRPSAVGVLALGLDVCPVCTACPPCCDRRLRSRSTPLLRASRGEPSFPSLSSGWLLRCVMPIVTCETPHCSQMDRAARPCGGSGGNARPHWRRRRRHPGPALLRPRRALGQRRWRACDL